MALPIPATLKTADIARFALRAGQLEKMEPVIAYWCNYWIVNQILSKNLHNSNDECMTYTVHVMDKLEKVKAEQGENDAIIDDVTGKAYVEQFGLETLERAEKTMNQSRVSRQTADTLHAAATFLELCQIWGPLEPELASKIKFAKYHAVRIARAIKAGEDPNLSNPVPESSETEEHSFTPSGNLESPGFKNIPDAENINHGSRQPFVEEIPDGHDQFEPHHAQESLINQSLHSFSAHSQSRPQNQDVNRRHDAMPPEINEYYTQPPTSEKSPHEPPWTSHSQSDGGEYFPRGAQPGNFDSVPFLPEIPSGNPSYIRPADLPLNSAETSPQAPSRLFLQDPDRPQPRSLESFPPLQMNEPPAPEQARAPTSTSVPQHFNGPRNPPARPKQPSFQQPQLKTQGPVGSGFHDVGQPQMPNQTSFVADEEAIMAAQKHAKWAISALNFEDVNTAIKELKGALEALGVRS